MHCRLFFLFIFFSSSIRPSVLFLSLTEAFPKCSRGTRVQWQVFYQSALKISVQCGQRRYAQNRVPFLRAEAVAIAPVESLALQPHRQRQHDDVEAPAAASHKACIHKAQCGSCCCCASSACHRKSETLYVHAWGPWEASADSKPLCRPFCWVVEADAHQVSCA